MQNSKVKPRGSGSAPQKNWRMRMGRMRNTYCELHYPQPLSDAPEYVRPQTPECRRAGECCRPALFTVAAHFRPHLQDAAGHPWLSSDVCVSRTVYYHTAVR
eukprot:1986339-Prymnesium_polylepis.1